MEFIFLKDITLNEFTAHYVLELTKKPNAKIKVNKETQNTKNLKKLGQD